MGAVGHLWFCLLSHLLRNYWVDSNETCLLGLPQCLVVVCRQTHIWLPNVPFVTLLSHLLWSKLPDLVVSVCSCASNKRILVKWWIWHLGSLASLSVTIGHHAVGGEVANPQIYVSGESRAKNKLLFSAIFLKERCVVVILTSCTCLLSIDWAASRENVSSGIFDEVRFKPACSATEAR